MLGFVCVFFSFRNYYTISLDFNLFVIRSVSTHTFSARTILYVLFPCAS